MSQRSDFTVILVSDRDALRGDLKGRSRLRLVRPVESFDRSADGSLLDAVKVAVKDSRAGKPGRRVAILSTSIWNQIVNLPRLGIEGVQRDDVAQALKFEVEPLVGIEPDAAVLGFSELPGSSEHRRFWTNVGLAHEWNEVRKFMSDEKAKEIFLGHPAAGSNPNEKPRIEIWADVVLQFSDNGTLNQISHSPSSTERWASDFGFDSIDSATRQNDILLAFSATEHVQSGHQNVTNLQETADLETWFEGAANRLAAAKDDQLPLIRQERKKAPAVSAWLARAGALLAVVAFCGWHLSWLNGTDQRLQEQLADIERPAIEKRKFDAMLGQVMRERTESLQAAKTTKAELQQVRFFFESQTNRLHALMAKLVELRTSNLVIKEISVNERGTTVAGVALESEAAPLLTNRLRESASLAGWKIHPPSQQGQLKMTNGGPWDFSILLEDVGPPGRIVNPGGNTAASGKGQIDPPTKVTL